MATKRRTSIVNYPTDVITAFRDIPYFLLNKELDPGEVSNITREFQDIKRYYEIYQKGSKFTTEGSCGDYIPSQTRYKIGRILIDKQARFMFGQKPDFVIKGTGDEIENEKVQKQLDLRQKIIDKVLEGNKGCNISKLLVQSAKDCFIAKRVAILVDMNETKGIKIHFFRSTQFIYETDYDDTDNLLKFVAFITVKESNKMDSRRILVKRYTLELVRDNKDGFAQDNNRNNGVENKENGNKGKVGNGSIKGTTDRKESRTTQTNNGNGTNQQQIEPETYKCFVEETLYDGRGKVISVVLPKTETEFEYIPAVIITNGGLLGNVRGESEIEQLSEMESGYSKLANADMDAERKGMNPIRYTVDMSTESTEGLSSSAGSYWDLQHNQEMDSPVPMVGTLAPAMNHTTAVRTTLERIKNSMYSEVDVPNIDLETMEGIITSGKALKAIYWPLTIRCDEKLKVWNPALQFMMEVIIDGAMKYPNITKSKYLEEVLTPIEFECCIEVNYPLPEDEQEEKEINLQEVDAKTMSRKAYMQKWRLLSDEEADEEIEQIAYETNLIENGGNSGGSDEFGSEGRDGESFWQEKEDFEPETGDRNNDEQQFNSFSGN